IPLAALAAQRASDHDVAVLEGLLAEFNTAVVDFQLITELDRQVHHFIAQIASKRLAGALTLWIVDVLQTRLSAGMHTAVVEAVIAEQHRALIAAIVRREPIAAERAMREHLLYLRDVVNAVECTQAEMAQRSDG